MSNYRAWYLLEVQQIFVEQVNIFLQFSDYFSNLFTSVPSCLSRAVISFDI